MINNGKSRGSTRIARNEVSGTMYTHPLTSYTIPVLSYEMKSEKRRLTNSIRGTSVSIERRRETGANKRQQEVKQTLKNNKKKRALFQEKSKKLSPVLQETHTHIQRHVFLESRESFDDESAHCKHIHRCALMPSQSAIGRAHFLQRNKTHWSIFVGIWKTHLQPCQTSNRK